MGKLRHIAIQVPDLEKAAAFYEGVFGLKRLKKVDAPIGNAISLSDGVIFGNSLTGCVLAAVSRLQTPRNGAWGAWICFRMGGFIAYYRVSTGKQRKSGLGIEAQRQAVSRHTSGA
jgi:catechol 2,3-dioxygenase-like lactoylglutathione lyase family enzyme